MKKLKSTKINLLIVFCIITMFIFISYNRYVLATINNDEEISFVLEGFFTNKNNCILSKDLEGLGCFYNLDNKISRWAYETEVQKINYLDNWSSKQGINFNNIKSNIKINNVKSKANNVYSIICSISTDVTYNYLNDSTENTFGLASVHYLDLKIENDNLTILKEWYADPLVDSLDLKKIKADNIQEFILAQKYPNFILNKRLEKAMDYAHSYCGVSLNGSDFKYNSNYKDFNSQGGDCANFASQILHEGGFKKNSIWNYSAGSGTKAWVNAQAFKNYMVNSGRGNYICKGKYENIYKEAFKLRPGDFVAYEDKGKITHISTVTGLDSKGYPLVTCHNADRLLVPYDLGWSNSNIVFHLIHVNY